MDDTYTFGPVEFFVIEFVGDGPDPAVLASLAELSAAGTVRVLDLVTAVRGPEGDVVMTELAQTSAATALPDLAFRGLVAEEDLVEMLTGAPQGSGVAIAALELLWATELAARVAAAQGRVVRSERIPAR
ncbi:hypothetical protein G7085_18635 [Tessaracoccus sp. HDW20]|uniref:DUF6325 family protein n=1 Tax=Tessaracoccus coleopterorum TaxID=2714950 RepID=UPI0018D45DB9|nr:DUF6325 family protein [Tessaracoccus coleopterorum]NHB85887.1 hypothetical protein [Tessaracoccus coleopterorum]